MISYFDLETTGVDTSEDRIVQIAVVKGDEEKSILINPERPIPAGASEVHGITDDMVANAPTFRRIAKALLDFLRGTDLAGYNIANFDIPILISEFGRIGIMFPDWEPKIMDGFMLEKLLNSHRLEDTYIRYMGKPMENAHDALADVKATMDVMAIQTTKLGEPASDQLDEMIQDQFGTRVDYSKKLTMIDGEICWAFGKHRHQPVRNNLDYINWVLNANFPIDTKTILTKLLTA